MKKAITKILIANRGEIAVRISKTCRKMGIQVVCVYSDADRNGLHVSFADEAYYIGNSPSAESYLLGDKIIEVAKSCGADAIHPGYGFLAENSEFSKMCESAGIVFIGPTPDSILKMGLKNQAKEIAIKSDVPTIPGYNGEDHSISTFKSRASELGLPVLLKASAGGGGKGMGIVSDMKDFEASYDRAKRESQKSFGNDHLMLERYFPSCKHIEVQVFGDGNGTVIHLFERECSLQRRHQKIIEEAPSPSIDQDVRSKICQAAVRLAESVNYKGAGTVEFIYDSSTKEFYFLEMNTRLQVEHPVTEEITGLDLVQMQIEVASGDGLSVEQVDVQMNGHSIECRVYTEDVAGGFLPGAGRVIHFSVDSGSDCRVDSAIRENDDVTIFYDPMVAKLITHGGSRHVAINKMLGSLRKTVFWGPKNNLKLLAELLKSDQYVDGSFNTNFVEQNIESLISKTSSKNEFLALAWTIYHFNKLDGNIPWGFQNNPGNSLCEEFNFDGDAVSIAYEVTRDRKLVFKNQTVELIEITSAGSDHGEVAFGLDGARHRFFVGEKATAGEFDYEIYVSNYCGESAQFHVLNKTPSPELKIKEGDYASPMPGKIVKVFVKPGQSVSEGERLVILEAMKMENEIRAYKEGIVSSVLVAPGEQVDSGKILIQMRGE